MLDKIANWASIASLIISLFILRKVIIISNKINIDKSINSKQKLKANNNEDTDIKQSGGDIR